MLNSLQKETELHLEIQVLSFNHFNELPHTCPVSPLQVQINLLLLRLSNEQNSLKTSSNNSIYGTQKFQYYYLSGNNFEGVWVKIHQNYRRMHLLSARNQSKEI